MLQALPSPAPRAARLTSCLMCCHQLVVRQSLAWWTGSLPSPGTPQVSSLPVGCRQCSWPPVTAGPAIL